MTGLFTVAGLVASRGAGYDGPPELTPARLLLGGSFDPWLLTGVLAAVGFYLVGRHRLRARGDTWSDGRTVAWLLGLAVLGYGTMGGLAVYDDVLFSAHVAQHILIAMVAPILLALGAPITLALRTLPRGPRKAVIAALHSAPARMLSWTPVGFAIFIGSLYGLYFTGIYEATLRHDVLHELLHVHLVVTGCLFFWPLLGIDPVPGRLPYWGRLVTLFVTLPAHAIIGLAILQSTRLIAGDYYTTLGRPWGASALSDQQSGGGIMWGGGDLMAALLFGAFLVQWMRAEERLAIREDRRLDRSAAATVERSDRDLDARTAAYNTRLAALAAREERATRPAGRSGSRP